MCNILVVEDDVSVRDMVVRFLERAGYKVTTASNGREAMDAVEDMPPDVVVTDVFMPEKDGVELILELARLPTRPRVVAMSGGGILGTTSMLDVVGKLGAVTTLPKPFGKDELLVAVEAALEA